MAEYATSDFIGQLSMEELLLLHNTCKKVQAGYPDEPRLQWFALQVLNPFIAPILLQEYMNGLTNCACWYCEQIRPLRQTPTLYHVYLKELLRSNGTAKVQMS